MAYKSDELGKFLTPCLVYNKSLSHEEVKYAFLELIGYNNRPR